MILGSNWRERREFTVCKLITVGVKIIFSTLQCFVATDCVARQACHINSIIHTKCRSLYVAALS